jgi:hypothetical protein
VAAVEEKDLSFSNRKMWDRKMKKNYGEPDLNPIFLSYIFLLKVFLKMAPERFICDCAMYNL